jgi:hypothetical protein
MRKAYRILSGLIAVLVVVQAAAVAYGAFDIDKVIDKAKDHGDTITNASSTLDGGAGYGLHGLLGTTVIPVVALALLVVSFMAHVPDGVKWAVFVVLDVIMQVALGVAAHAAAALGWLHGLNALILFALAGYAARRSATVQPATVTATTAPATTE